MKRIRKLCIVLLVCIYACGVSWPLMGWFNKPQMIFGIPCFIFGIVLLGLLLLAVVFFLYRYECREEGSGGEKS